MKIEFDEDSFVKQARAGNLQAVELFHGWNVQPVEVAVERGAGRKQ